MSTTKYKVVKVGVMSLEQYKQRTIAIAAGKYRPNKDEPKIWFHSIKSLANILSEENRELLKLIIAIHPRSIQELEPLTGRKANNLLRTLRTMESYGLVRLHEGKPGRGRTPLVPEVIYGAAEVDLDFVS
jgi:predicted transcriptional regulator